MIKAVKKARVFYLAMLAIAGCVFAFEEFDVLPKGFLQSTPQTDYVVNLICVILTLGGTWGALRLFALKNVRAKLESSPQSYFALNAVRTGIISFVLFVNLFVYYAFMNGTTSLFCMLIALVGMLFCWPGVETASDNSK